MRLRLAAGGPAALKVMAAAGAAAAPVQLLWDGPSGETTATAAPFPFLAGSPRHRAR